MWWPGARFDLVVVDQRNDHAALAPDGF